MAEFVQQNIEDMLPELEQMERVGLFSTQETRCILQKRKKHEYKLKRQTKHKEDYMSYVQYEINLLSLIKKRREGVGYNFKKLEIDVAIIRRIHRLFTLACYRFQDDVNLWLSHVEFCKAKNEKSKVSKIFTRLLQVHNKKPGLWVLAAKWEFEDNASPDTARSLLQRGLRFNPVSKELWQEYFRMELMYTDTLRKRRLVLGVNDDATDTNSDVIITCKIAPIVYRKATEAVPGDVEFALSFIQICHLFKFTDELVEQIFVDIKTQHDNKEITWDAVARKHLAAIPRKKSKMSSKVEKFLDAKSERLEQECFAVYDEAAKHLNTETMWSLYLKCCLERLEVKSNRDLKCKRIHHTQTVFQQACNEQKLSAVLFAEWIKLLVNTAQIEQARTLAEEGTSKHKRSVLLWRERLHLEICCQSSENEIYMLFNIALKTVKLKEAWPVWTLVLDFLLVKGSDKIEDLLELGINQCEAVSVPVKEFYIEWVALSEGIQKVRKLYKRLSQSKPLSVAFFRNYINLENAQPIPKMKKLRLAYEDAVREFGDSNTELWLEYIKLELTHNKGRPENAGQLHWRAVKSLSGEFTETFVTQYTLMQTGHLA